MVADARPTLTIIDVKAKLVWWTRSAKRSIALTRETTGSVSKKREALQAQSYLCSSHSACALFALESAWFVSDVAGEDRLESKTKMALFQITMNPNGLDGSAEAIHKALEVRMFKLSSWSSQAVSRAKVKWSETRTWWWCQTTMDRCPNFNKYVLCKPCRVKAAIQCSILSNSRFRVSQSALTWMASTVSLSLVNQHIKSASLLMTIRHPRLNLSPTTNYNRIEAAIERHPSDSSWSRIITVWILNLRLFFTFIFIISIYSKHFND